MPNANAGCPMRLFLVRHGEIAGPGVLHGHVDLPLTALGVRQMEAVARSLAAESLAAVYTSDLQRARRGGEIVARGRGLAVVADPALRELDMGQWDDRSVAGIWEQQPERLRAWWADLENVGPPGGESLGAMRRRVIAALSRLLDRHPGQTVCLVGHAGVTRLLLFDALGIPVQRFHGLAQDFGCVNLIEYFPRADPVVRYVNRVPAPG